MKNVAFSFFVLLLFSCANSEIENKYMVPDDYFQNYLVVETNDFSYGNVKRISIKIMMLADLKEENLKKNLKLCIKNAYKQDQYLKAISVEAYLKDSDTDGAYNVAKCDFAPFGDWSRADEDVPLSDYDFTFDIK